MGVILENLVQNGIEAMPEGGELTITTANEDGHGVIYVRDSGVGVPSNMRSELFEPLRGSSKENGLGMGLSVTRALARAMGGELTYVSGDRGSSFALSLRLHETV